MKIYFLHNGDMVPRYIGSTNQKLMLRKNNHWQDLRNKSDKVKWIKELKDCGGKLYIHLIEECEDNEGYAREKHWTIFYKDTILNMKLATEHTDEHKEYMSLLKRGIKKSVETKAKMKEFQKTRWKKVFVNGEEYPSIHHASKGSGISVSFISAMCNKTRTSTNNKIYFL